MGQLNEEPKIEIGDNRLAARSRSYFSFISFSVFPFTLFLPPFLSFLLLLHLFSFLFFSFPLLSLTTATTLLRGVTPHTPAYYGPVPNKAFILTNLMSLIGPSTHIPVCVHWFFFCFFLQRRNYLENFRNEFSGAPSPLSHLPQDSEKSSLAPPVRSCFSFQRLTTKQIAFPEEKGKSSIYKDDYPKPKEGETGGSLPLSIILVFYNIYLQSATLLMFSLFICGK